MPGVTFDAENVFAIGAPTERGAAMRRRAVILVATLLATFSTLAVLRPAYAAAGCRVDYAVTNQWSGGFQASVTLTNVGDPLNGWTLRFSFPDTGQKLTQGWSATWAQSGTAVTAANASWNGSVATGGTVSLGFTGTFTGANPSPAQFTINNTACTGTVPTTSPTTAPTTPPTTPPTTNPTTPPPSN